MAAPRTQASGQSEHVPGGSDSLGRRFVLAFCLCLWGGGWAKGRYGPWALYDRGETRTLVTIYSSSGSWGFQILISNSDRRTRASRFLYRVCFGGRGGGRGGVALMPRCSCVHIKHRLQSRCPCAHHHIASQGFFGRLDSHLPGSQGRGGVVPPTPRVLQRLHPGCLSPNCRTVTITKKGWRRTRL